MSTSEDTIDPGMNWEYLHLISHPFAIVLPIAGAAVGIIGWMAGREELERWGIVAILLGGAAAVPSYFTGIAAADDVAQRTFVEPSLIQTHRTWATWAAVLLSTAAIFAGYSIVQPREQRLRRFVLVVGAASALLTGCAAFRGGMIEHGADATAAEEEAADERAAGEQAADERAAGEQTAGEQTDTDRGPDPTPDEESSP